MTRGPDKQFEPEVALSKAMEVFWAHGYEASSLSALLKHMGIGKKSLYDTFGNKRSLFLKALDHYAQTTLRDIRERLLATGSPRDNLRQVLRSFYEMNSQPHTSGCMLGTNIADFNTADEDVAQVMRVYLKQLEDAFCTAVARAQDAGEIRATENPRQVARLLLCATQGMALLGRILDDDTWLAGPSQVALNLLS